MDAWHLGLPKQGGEVDELEHVEKQTRQVADKKDDDNRHQHQRQVHLTVGSLSSSLQEEKLLFCKSTVPIQAIKKFIVKSSSLAYSAGSIKDDGSLLRG
jgi:hypothetical protein